MNTLAQTTGPDTHAPKPAADAVYSKIAKRIVPFLVLLWLTAWLDRVNVGFAKLQMLQDLGLSEAVFGLGAGIFYVGYLLFEVPSNLFLEKIGARKTIARITILWGLTTIATGFVHSATSFYVLRFLLGAFEAGLYPGVILYLTYWFPARRRAQMVGLFMTGVPLGGILGGPIAGWIMGSMGGHLGFANWQWLFLLEGIPPLILGIVTIVALTDKPAQARWLTDGEKHLVLADLEQDQKAMGITRHSFFDALRSPQVWLLTLIYFCLVSANPTLGFWTPTIIKGLGVKSDVVIGLLSSLPYVIGVCATILVGRHSDKKLERRYHCALSTLAAATGLVLIGWFANSPTLAFLALVLAVAGVLSAFAPFWQMPTMLLSGSAAAGGIALINSLGNLSGFVGPALVGWLKDITGKTSTGLYAVAGLEVLCTVLILVFMPRASRQAAAVGDLRKS
ncbi:MFS transporter [Paraburkholderia sp. RL17-337-BIB-A]|uniref:MFS transporter n=1 Tax=Paraburkholderia sp. RL17-337-BIB-A TaxID=3031636 RepID=UPI0038B80EB2